MRFLYTIMGVTCMATIGAMAAGNLGSTAKMKSPAVAHMGAPAVAEPTAEDFLDALRPTESEKAQATDRLDRVRAFASGATIDEREMAIDRWQERLDEARLAVQQRNAEARNTPKRKRDLRRSSSPPRYRARQRPRNTTAIGRYQRTNVLQRSSWRKKVRRYFGGSNGYSRSNYNTGRYRRPARVGSSRNYR